MYGLWSGYDYSNPQDTTANGYRDMEQVFGLI